MCACASQHVRVTDVRARGQDCSGQHTPVGATFEGLEGLIDSPALKTAMEPALREPALREQALPPSPSQDEWPVLEDEEVTVSAAHKREAEVAADAQRRDSGADDSTSSCAPPPGPLAELVALRTRLAEVETEAAQARADAVKAHADARQIALYNRQLLDRLAALEETSTTSPHSRVRAHTLTPVVSAILPVGLLSGRQERHCWQRRRERVKD
jgi:hypothetical protein